MPKINIEETNKRREIVQNLYVNGVSYQKMVDMLNCSMFTIGGDVRWLKQNKKITKEMEEMRSKRTDLYKRREERKQEALNLMEQGKGNYYIKRTLKMDLRMIRSYRREFKEQNGEIIQSPKKNILPETNTEKKGDPRVFTDYMLEFNNQLMNGTLKKEKLLTIKTIANFTGKYEYVVFALKVHIKFGELKTALEILKRNLNNKDYTKTQRDKLKEMECKIENIERKNKEIKANDER